MLSCALAMSCLTPYSVRSRMVACTRHWSVTPKAVLAAKLRPETRHDRTSSERQLIKKSLLEGVVFFSYPPSPLFWGKQSGNGVIDYMSTVDATLFPNTRSARLGRCGNGAIDMVLCHYADVPWLASMRRCRLSRGPFVSTQSG